MKSLNRSGPRPTGPLRSDTDRREHEMLPFVSKCPSCTREQPQSGFSLAALQRLLDGGYPIEAYCVPCDEFWPISLSERVTLTERLLAAGE